MERFYFHLTELKRMLVHKLRTQERKENFQVKHNQCYRKMNAYKIFIDQSPTIITHRIGAPRLSRTHLETRPTVLWIILYINTLPITAQKPISTCQTTSSTMVPIPHGILAKLLETTCGTTPRVLLTV